MAISVHKRGNRLRSSHQWGGVMIATPLMLVGGLMLFGLAYDGYRAYRENIEQDRRARSIGVVALKAYQRAGCSYDRDGNNAGRVTFALNAAMNAVDIKDVTARAIPAVTLPSSGPVEVVFEDTSGPSLAKVVVRLGSLSSADDTSLEGLNPCKVVPFTGLNLSASAVDNWEAGQPFDSGLIPSNFNWRQYLAWNLDLLGSGLDTEIEAKRHFAWHGKREGRLVGYDNWEAGQPFQSGLIPSDFDWKQYLISNLDLVGAGLDTEIEAKRHFAKYGLEEGRSGYTSSRQEAHQFIGAEVRVSGLSSTMRNGGFARLFGINTLGRSNSQVLVVRDMVRHPLQGDEVQPLQVAEIEIGSNPPIFRRPVLDRSKVSYTMSMDVLIERTGSGWRNIFSPSDVDCCNNVTRRPALFISGLNDYSRPNAVHIVHGTTPSADSSFGTGDHNGNNRHIVTSFTATPGVYFNVTWTVDNGRLTTYINGVPDAAGSTTGDFTWGEENWRWNSFLTQHPTRTENTAGSVKVKNVYWWNRPLAAAEIASLRSSGDSATLFQHCTFGSEPNGWQIAVRPGRYSNISSLGVNQRHLSSLRVPPGMKVILYEGVDFQGRSVTLTGDSPCLTTLGFNDATSSLVVEKDAVDSAPYRFVEPAQ
jgi:hypothetical protein